jgi:hypothetical protein
VNNVHRWQTVGKPGAHLHAIHGAEAVKNGHLKIHPQTRETKKLIKSVAEGFMFISFLKTDNVSFEVSGPDTMFPRRLLVPIPAVVRQADSPIHLPGGDGSQHDT